MHHVLLFAFDLAEDRGRALRLDDLNRARDLALALSPRAAPYPDLDPDAVVPRLLARVFDLHVDFHRDRAEELALALALDRALELERTGSAGFAAKLAAELAGVLERLVPTDQRIVRTGSAVKIPAALDSEAPRPLGRTTRALLAAAVRRLPPGDRDRYEEEWKAESRDHPRRARWAHGVRVLRQTRATTRALQWRPGSDLDRQHPW